MGDYKQTFFWEAIKNLRKKNVVGMGVVLLYSRLQVGH